MAAIVQKLCHTAELFHNVTKYSLTASYKKLYTAWQYKLYRRNVYVKLRINTVSVTRCPLDRYSLQVHYAEKLRTFLETKFNTIEIITFEERVFEGIEQDICLVYLSNEPKAKAYIQYTTFKDVFSPTPVSRSKIMRNKPLKKWSNCILNDEETEKLLQLSKRFLKISQFGDISPGIVTGANSFFILSQEEVDKLKIPTMHILPIIMKSSAIPPLLSFTSLDFENTISQSNRTHLVNLNGLAHESFSEELIAYIAKGEEEKINERYKCKKRRRWYDVPIIKKGDACFFKRYHIITIENTIGDFSGVFLFSKRLQQGVEKEKYFYKSGNQSELPWKGVRIYRDNFRVRPYGDPDSSAYDWLLLSNRKAKSPAAPSHPDGKWRVAADQICGTVLISRTNITLPDQANREGFVETPEFSILKNFLLAIIQLFERDRQYVFKKLSAYYEKTHPTQQFESEITQKAAFAEAQKKQDCNTLSQNVALEAQTTVEAAKAQAVIDQRDAQIQSLENENQLLRALATIGIITNTYVHEIRGSTNTLGLKVVMAKEELEYDKNIKGALKYINEAITCQQSFGSWFKVTIESVKKDRRTMKNVNLHELFEDLKKSWSDTCPDTEISIECDQILFRCFPYEIESINDRQRQCGELCK